MGIHSCLTLKIENKNKNCVNYSFKLGQNENFQGICYNCEKLKKKSIPNLKNKMISLIHLLRHYFSNITPSFSNVTATKFQ